MRIPRDGEKIGFKEAFAESLDGNSYLCECAVCGRETTELTINIEGSEIAFHYHCLHKLIHILRNMIKYSPIDFNFVTTPTINNYGIILESTGTEEETA